MSHDFELFYRTHRFGTLKKTLDDKFGSEIYEPEKLQYDRLFEYFLINSIRYQGLTTHSTARLFHLLLKYEREKQIFVVNKTLWEGIKDAEIPDSISVHSMFLPQSCAILDVGIRGSFFYIVPDTFKTTSTNAIASWEIGEVSNCGSINFRIFGNIYENGTIGDACIGSDNCANEEFALFKQVLLVLLYIRGQRDVVRAVHPGEKPTEDEIPQLPKQPDYQPEVYSVGNRYAYVIEHWEDPSVVHPSTLPGSTKRPHWRRPHPHLYHTNNGPVVHFLGLVRVKGAAWDQYDPNKTTEILVK